MFTQNPLDATFIDVCRSAQRPLSKVTNDLVSEEQTTHSPLSTLHTHLSAQLSNILINHGHNAGCYFSRTYFTSATCIYGPGLLRSHRSGIIWSLSALFHLENAFKVHPCFPSSIYYLEWQDFLVLFCFFLQMNNIPLYTDCTISLSVHPSTDVCLCACLDYYKCYSESGGADVFSS